MEIKNKWICTDEEEERETRYGPAFLYRPVLAEDIYAKCRATEE